MSKPQPILLESEAALIPTVDGHVIKREQIITDQFLDSIAEDRFRSKNTRANNFHKIADIPNLVVEKWLREGFDIFDPNVRPSEIVARLKREGLDKFIATNKSV